MRKPNPDFPRLTKNDQEVLKSIIMAAKLPDAEIAKKMGLSPQAVFKIRHKLEEKGIIKGYQPVLDLQKLGITAMAFAVIRFKQDIWDAYSEAEIAERVKEIPYIIDAYRVTAPEATHLLLMGFRDLKQMDRYLARLQTRFGNEVELKQVYPFSTERIITQSSVGLLYEILDKHEFPVEEFFLRRKK